MQAGSRSLIRRMGAPQDLRKRRYLVRAALLLTGIAAIVLFVQAVQSRSFDPDGPGRVIYQMHDALYLRARGHAWVAYFPYVLVWLVPLAVIAALTAWEFLSRNGPVRRLHAGVILFCAGRPVLTRLLGGSLSARKLDADVWAGMLEPNRLDPPRRFGFARRVIKQAEDRLWRELAVAMGDGILPEPRQVTRMFRLARMRAMLDPGDPTAHLRVLEQCVLFPDDPTGQALRRDLNKFYDMDANSALTEALRQVSEDLDSEEATLSPDIAAQRINRLAAGLKIKPGDDINAEALRLACLVLRTARLAGHHQIPESRAFFSHWLDRKLRDADFRKVADRAEALVFFELWARLGEPDDAGLDGDDLLAAAGLDKGTPALLNEPEAYAWTGGGWA